MRGPTIVKFYESFNSQSSIFIVMEYASKGNLEMAIQRKIMTNTRFSTKYIFRFLAHVVMAVMAIHSKNILHRDIKTQNIFMTKSGMLKLGDFGVSREISNTMAKTFKNSGSHRDRLLNVFIVSSVDPATSAPMSQTRSSN